MRPYRSTTKLVVWHCSATPPSRAIGVSDLRIMHQARGWDDIGYHIVILRDGKVQMGEDISKRGAHAKGHNSISVAVVFIGGVGEDGHAENNYTDAQWVAAKHVFKFLVLLYPNANHVGHRDLSPDKDSDGRIQRWEFMKECPCYSVQEWIENDLAPLSNMYSEWELSLSVPVSEEVITIEEVLADNNSSVGMDELLDAVGAEAEEAPKPSKKKRSKKK